MFASCLSFLPSPTPHTSKSSTHLSMTPSDYVQNHTTLKSSTRISLFLITVTSPYSSFLPDVPLYLHVVQSLYRISDKWKLSTEFPQHHSQCDLRTHVREHTSPLLRILPWISVPRRGKAQFLPWVWALLPLQLQLPHPFSCSFRVVSLVQVSMLSPPCCCSLCSLPKIFNGLPPLLTSGLC